ncbi:MAG: hypothetical protein ACI4AQ_07170 [Lachnospiraceae bacterium]
MEDNKIDDIINMLDNFTENGGGHMNVAVDGKDANQKTVETTNSNCCNSNMACMVPTMHEGLDEHLEE